jgi:hypothetical protein
VPLKDWEPKWYKETKQQALYGQRQMIAEEFIDGYVVNMLVFRFLLTSHPLPRCQEDENKFLTRWGSSVKNITSLVKAIRARDQGLKLRGVRAKKHELHY